MSRDTINLILNVLGLMLGGTALGVILRFLTNRHKLRNEDVADIRDHYAAEVTALRESNRKLESYFRKMIDDLESKHTEDMEKVVGRQRECEEREMTLRDRVRKLEDELEGTYRTMVAVNADNVIALGDLAPTRLRKLAEQTIRAQGRQPK